MLKNRHVLRKKEGKRLSEEIESILGCSLNGVIEVADYKNKKVIIINGKVLGFFVENIPFLNVSGLKKFGASKRYVLVDDGAIKFILNGADVTAPGIIDADENIKRSDIVWVGDSRKMPIAVGIALMDGIEMVEENRGKAVKTFHHTGDEMWRLSEGF